VLNKKQRQARLIAADGFQLQFSTNQPIFQVYIGGQTPFEGKEKTVYRAHSGICLEQQAEPDAPHHPNFNDIYLSKGHSKINSLTIQFEQ
jgi:galactose mutarotase-like enzyme